VPGEGVGAVLLKPLALAERDRDRILGVIKGTRVHHSGQGNGYRVPNPNTQADAIVRLFEQTAIDPESIGYVEVAANAFPSPIRLRSPHSAKPSGASPAAASSAPLLGEIQHRPP